MNFKNFMNFKNSKAGFTLIEILIVVTITAIIATVGTISYNGAIKRDQLDSYSKEILSTLEKARTKAINQEEGDYWGVRFEANTSSAFSNFAIFKGAVSSTNFIDVKTLNTNVNFTSPNPSGAAPIEEIVFNKSTGTIKDGINHLIQISSGSLTKDIYINKNGLISLGLPSSVDVLPAPTLTSPSDGTIIGIVTSQNLVWGAVTEAQSYRLQVSTDINFGSFFFDDSTLTSASYTTTGLQAYTVYYWRVNAYSLLTGSGLWSSTRSFGTLTSPSAPVSPSGSPTNGINILAWSVPTTSGGSSITGYKIYWGTVSGNLPNTINPGNVLTYNHTGLTNGTTYYYKVVAINEVGEGAQTSEFSSTPQPPPTAGTLTITPSTASYVPATVTTLSAPFTSNLTVTVCEYTTNGSTWTAATVSGTAPNFTCTKSSITGLVDGTSYTFNMRATNTSGTTTATALTRIADVNGPAITDNWTNNWTAISPVVITLTSTDNQYLSNSEFSDINSGYTPGWDTSLNLTYTPSNGFGSGYNSGVTSPAIGYHAHINPTAGVGGTPGFEYIDLNCQYGYCHRWLGTAYGLGTAASRSWGAGTQITVTLDGKVDAIGKPVAFGLYYTNLSGTTNFLSGLQQQTFIAINTWETKTYAFTLISDIDTSKVVSLYVYGSYGTEGSLWVDNVKLSTAGSGISTTKYCVDTANTCAPSSGTTGISVSVTCASSSTCTQYVRYASWDNVGNASPVYSKTVRQDTQLPTATDNWTNNWTLTSPVTVTITPSDASGSGVSTTKYCVDTANTCLPSSGTVGTSASVTCVSGICAQYVRYQVWDVLGNISTVYSKQVRQDKEIPTVTDNWTDVWTPTSPVTITLTPTDGSGSGVATTKYCVDTANTCTPSTGTVGTSVSVTCASGSACTQYVRYAAWDNVNNASAISYETVRQDLIVPTNGTLTVTPGAYQNSLSWSGFSDANSGLATSNTYKVVYLTTGSPNTSCTNGSVAYTGTGTSTLHTGLTGGSTYYYRICAYDVAGNISTGATNSGIPTTTTTTTVPAATWTLNAGTGTSCTTVCTGLSKLCSGLSISGGVGGYGDSTYEYYVSSCTVRTLGAACSLAMTNKSYTCAGHNAYWTYCKCDNTATCASQGGTCMTNLTTCQNYPGCPIDGSGCAGVCCIPGC